MTSVDRQPDWLREPPRAAYVAALDAAELCARHNSEGGRGLLAAAAFDVDARWLANAGVRALARLVGGPHAPAWWKRLREEANDYTDEDDQLRVIAALEVIAVAEAVERGAFLRVEELTRESQFLPTDYAAVSARYIGLIAAHLEDEGAVGTTAVFAALRRQCGIGGAA